MSPSDTAVLDVGQVLPLEHRPAAGTLRRIAALVTDGVPAAAVAALRDPRIDVQAWPGVLAREIALTVGWASRRMLATHPAAPRWDGSGTAIVLLPAHGTAVHLIRRALPFALCGIPTRVAGHDEHRRIVSAAVGVLADLMDLADVLRPAESAVACVRDAADRDLVVLTGRPTTAFTVRRATSAQVLGATGGCAVLIGSIAEAVSATAAVLRRHDHPDSCTSFGGSWIHDGTSWRDEHGRAADPADRHPSVIYRLVADLDQPPEVHAGYTVLPCDRSGVVGTLVGFARDPRHGWPGDFLI